MLIINADDWGESPSVTDAALACFRQGRITSVSAMVFMEDSERAAAMANETHLDAGLHLNFTDSFTGKNLPGALVRQSERVIRFLRTSKYAQLLFNPRLMGAFSDLFHRQMEEFIRIYGRPPSHIDGHQHMHLCANMQWQKIIPSGLKVRRNFSFEPGEKSFLNRSYRKLSDNLLLRRHRLPDYFFSLGRALQNNNIERILGFATHSQVELMTHPIIREEHDYLLSGAFAQILKKIPKISYSEL